MEVVESGGEDARLRLKCAQLEGKGSAHDPAVFETQDEAQVDAQGDMQGDVSDEPPPLTSSEQARAGRERVRGVKR